MRLRKSLKVTNGGKKYTKKELSPAMITSDRHLLIPLYQSERAWAYAMQMKDEAGPDGLPPRVYFHLVRRYSKAAHWCKQLQSLATEKVDDKTTWEIEVLLFSSTPFSTYFTPKNNNLNFKLIFTN